MATEAPPPVVEKPLAQPDVPPASEKPLQPDAKGAAPGVEIAGVDDAQSASTRSALAALSAGGKGGSRDRDEALAKVSQDRTHSHIRAWEENEKAKSVNKFHKMIAKINAWENTKKATAEAQLRKEEEALEKNRAAYVEKMKNQIAAVHRAAEEKRAMAEARKGEEFVKAEESAAKSRATGQAPKKFLCCGA